MIRERPDEAREVKEEPKAMDTIKEEGLGRIRELEDINGDLPQASDQHRREARENSSAAQGPHQEATADPPTRRHQDWPSRGGRL